MIWPLCSVILVLVSYCAGCPTECSCKWKSGKKTVECSDRGLITIPNGIEKETQVLDISGNDLQSLHRETFQRSGLMDLQKMYMRSCHLGQIDRYAFRGLANLIEIDLSDNLLTHIPSLAFEDIPFLRNISLAHNPIQKVEPFSFGFVPNLIRLDLSHCDIQSVRSKAFDKLSNLEYLKLNGNQLQDLHVDTLEDLVKLKSIELDGNRWRCDCHLRAVKTLIDDRKINIPTPILCSGGPERIKDKSLAELDSADFACRPSIKTDIRYVESVIGDNVTIECRVESDPVATISWYFGSSHILPNNTGFDSSQRIFIIDSEDDIYDKRSKLVMKKVEEKDAGEYHCVAENRAGNDEANFTVYVLPPPSSIVSLSSTNINAITVGLGVLILFMLIVILLLVKKIRLSSYGGGSKDTSQNVKSPPEKNSMETSSQKSHDSEIKSESGKAFTVTSDLSYSRSLSDIGNPAFSNPDLISGTNVRDSTCITPLPITRPISDYCQNWQKSYAMPRAASSSGFNYDIHDRMPIIVDTVSAGSGSDDVFTHSSRMSNDYPPDYGLPILPENGISQPCAKTLKVWQRGVPVYPPMCSGPPPVPPPAFQTMPHSRNSPADRRYQRCGTDV
ncbi:leucine-rich repeat, immunoglobulin-like domain and transmembrane domain-containing protein 3 [Planococcus citri]|uniref:leucine-rich repeat, immunoglobulin-like domain and transmembrane domain-containing protein 3 n=1 Tax=Planococcus citri TaxID=170843 RepID=UPI0031F920C1